MAATNRYMNVSTVGFTPTATSTLQAIGGVKSAAYNEGLEALQESADFDAYITVGGVTLGNPTITLRTIDAFVGYSTIIPGDLGVLTITFRDFTNGASASGGAKIVTAGHCFLASRGRDAEYRQLATQSLMFHCNSTDGSTNPVSIAPA